MNKKFAKKLEQRVKEVDSHLCVGIDVDWQRGSPTRQVQDMVAATMDYAAAFKVNGAHYQAAGGDLLGLMQYFPADIPVILDMKLSDIKSTAEAWASFVFDSIGVDAVTVSPYMGIENLTPYAERGGVFVLGRTSNPESDIIQQQSWLEVLGSSTNYGLVMGANRLLGVRAARLVNNNWFLIPGVGTQGGSIKNVVKAAKHKFLINVSRGISQSLYPGQAAKIFRDRIKHELFPQSPF